MQLEDSSQNPDIVLQWQCELRADHPSDEQIKHWAEAAIGAEHQGSELVVRVVEVAEIQDANREWRSKNKATNVLSFPADFPEEAGVSYLGDILVCADVLLAESTEQGKSLHAHWAHIVVHGVLHLQGYDHIQACEAQQMEQREIEILNQLGFENPYETN